MRSKCAFKETARLGSSHCGRPTRRSRSAKRGSPRSGSKTDQYLSEVMKEDLSVYAFSSHRKALAVSSGSLTACAAPERVCLRAKYSLSLRSDGNVGRVTLTRKDQAIEIAGAVRVPADPHARTILLRG